MFKKITWILLASSILFWSTAFWVSYNFSNYPAKIYSWDINSYIKDWFKYLKYFWNTTFYWKKIDISPFINYINTLDNVRFMKLSYYWNDVLRRAENDEIDLDYLDNTRLRYPIWGVYVWDYLVMFIYKNSLNEEDKNTIWEYYNSNDLIFIKKWNWYITKIYNYKTTNSFSYEVSKYSSVLKSLYNNYKLLNFQVGQNPFDKYKIENFWDDILQLEVKLGEKLRGIVLSLQKIYSLVPTKNEQIFWQKYVKDGQIMRKLVNLYDEIENYYETMDWLPADLGSLYPNFYDITALNDYNHTIKYKKINYNCFKIWFKPKSKDFKRLFSFEINNDWYRFSKFCLK